jgi:hypothetical protein
LAPVIERFSVSPVWLAVGGSAMSSWTVSNATSVSLAPLGTQGGTHFDEVKYHQGRQP